LNDWGTGRNGFKEKVEMVGDYVKANNSRKRRKHRKKEPWQKERTSRTKVQGRLEGAQTCWSSGGVAGRGGLKDPFHAVYEIKRKKRNSYKLANAEKSGSFREEITRRSRLS